MTEAHNLSVVIMAAGRGTRMNSDIPKVLHQLSEKTLLQHVIDAAKELNPKKIVEDICKKLLTNTVIENYTITSK